MLDNPINDPTLVVTQTEFENMLADIDREPKLAVDTESNSLYAYREQVCLIQISTPSTDYLIDPFIVTDLSLLSAVFADPKKQKIFHAAEYDLICLKRDYSFEFANLFDTMVAARILGEKQVGLGSLLQINFGVTQDKHFQRANWGIRPLTKPMLDYARMDTHYLFALQYLLESRLKERDLLELAQEDFSILCETQPPITEVNGFCCWKVAGSVHINGREAAILQTLCNYRDQQAQKMNLPLFKVLSNDLLVELCQEPPQSLEELRQRHGVTARLFNRHGSGLMAALQEGQAAKPINRQPRIRPDEQFMMRLECLKEWRKQKARELKIESDIVLPKDLMEKIVSKNPRNRHDLQLIMQKTPWRFVHYGNAILKELKGVIEHENHL
jgi:ribonuclease D